MNDEQNEFLLDFLSESDEYLQILNDKMMDLENSIKNNTEMSSDDLNTMFRSAHTIKGTASFIGLNKVVSLTHKAETLLQKLRDNEVSLTEEIVNALFSAIDTLTVLLNSLRESGQEVGDIEQDVSRIEAILTKEDDSVSSPVPVAQEPQSPLEVKTEETPQEVEAENSVPVEPINEKYLEPFIVEMVQNIDSFEEILLVLEKEMTPEKINEIFRLAHTMKGSAGIINAIKITEVTHKIENILSYYRNSGIVIQSDIISLLFKAIDVIKSALGDLKSSTHLIQVDVAPVCSELEYKLIQITTGTPTPNPEEESSLPPENPDIFNIDAISEETKKKISALLETGQEIFSVRLVISKVIPIKSLKIALVEERLKKNGVLLDIKPEMSVIEAAEGDLDIDILFSSNFNERDVRQILSLDGIEVCSVERFDKKFFDEEADEVIGQRTKGETMATPSQIDNEESLLEKCAPIEISTIKIDSRKLDKLMNLSGELVIIRAQYSRLANLFNADAVQQKEILQKSLDITNYINTLSKELDEHLFSLENFENSGGLSSLQKILSNVTTNLDGLRQIVTKSDILDNIHALSETTSSLEKISSDIQSGVMQSRMIPIEGVFNRFKRIVRDISKDINKDVNLKIVGADTELDKKIVDSLGDPLTHMIRNAVDHGIEDKETRARLGKPEIGTIILKASHKGNSICIEISDDGKGMDSEKLAASAMKKGILTQDQVDKMNEKDKLNIIFLPGFSTAEQVTGLSGRGVGMDVVRDMISSLNGVVDIETELGGGTTFILKIPLTLAIIQSLLVSIGNEVYAFPLESVTEIIKESQKDIYSVDGNATVKLRDHALSLVDLEDVIYINNGNEKSEARSQRVVIINDGDTQLGVQVDSLVGKDEIVIKPFTEHFSGVRGITGASILADGTVALILDPITIIKESRQ